MPCFDLYGVSVPMFIYVHSEVVYICQTHKKICFFFCPLSIIHSQIHTPMHTHPHTYTPTHIHTHAHTHTKTHQYTSNTFSQHVYVVYIPHPSHLLLACPLHWLLIQLLQTQLLHTMPQSRALLPLLFHRSRETTHLVRPAVLVVEYQIFKYYLM